MKKLVAIMLALALVLALGSCLASGNNANDTATTQTNNADENDAGDTPGNDLVANDAERVQVAAGGSHSMTLHADGSLWLWGCNRYGQLGNGQVTVYEELRITENFDRYFPMHLKNNIVHIAASYGSSFAINDQGELFAWGYNHLGQLGDGTQENRATPTKIMDDVVFVDANWYSTIAITSSGALYAWGNDVRYLDWDTYFSTPTPVMDNVTSAAVGNWHMVILTDDNRVYGLGQANNLGIGDQLNVHITTPAFIMDNVREITTCAQNPFAITLDDRLYSWGPRRNSGIVTDEFWVFEPTFVMDNVYAAFAGGLILRNDDSLWISGELRSSHTSPHGGSSLGVIVEYGNAPVRVMENVLTAHAYGNSHVLAVTHELDLYAWGDNQHGKLGTGRANTFNYYYVDTGYGDMLSAEIDEDTNEAQPVRIGRVYRPELPADFIVTANLHLREEASADAQSIEVLSSGTRVRVVDFHNGAWFRVEHGGQTGYVSAEFLAR